MLTELRIRNFAVIEQLTVSLGPGLNVLTGETGAGKSIVVGALSLLLGERASADVVRTGADRASVEGVFEKQVLCFGAIAFATHCRLMEPDSGLGYAVDEIDTVQVHHSDAAVVVGKTHGERDRVIRGFIGVHLPDLVLVRDRTVEIAPTVHKRLSLVVRRLGEQLGVIDLQRSQIDSVSYHHSIPHGLPLSLHLDRV
jgi:predicted ATP-dependent endonuclease of OLD family